MLFQRVRGSYSSEPNQEKGFLSASRLNFSADCGELVARPVIADAQCQHLIAQDSNASHLLGTSTASGRLKTRGPTVASSASLFGRRV